MSYKEGLELSNSLAKLFRRPLVMLRGKKDITLLSKLASLKGFKDILIIVKESDRYVIRYFVVDALGNRFHFVKEYDLNDTLQGSNRVRFTRYRYK
ncbi:MAG: hypothetical protein ARM1_0278 [Candidatus Micrarchaeota archaeon]|nr:MAG: hypothetical protein ARM1_0278 [Candidatus Micrarchaeota archaeon]